MSRRLLIALRYPKADIVDINNDFRNIILWLEENKIKIADSSLVNSLKNINSPDWNKSFEQYKSELGCPLFKSNVEDLQWILGYAIQVETMKDKNRYLKHAVENLKISNKPDVVAENPLDKLDFKGKDFETGITELAKILDVKPHPDPLKTLRAVRKVVETRLNAKAVENPKDFIVTGTPFPFQDADLGFDLKDPVLNRAAKILRMLYIHNLRDLQTKANELIVAVQLVTANPKTDTKLGKVGR
ncbi:RNA transcription, translation and transport factor protein [Aethina tumida]|uniref:RNA transcription, translation and transport factor protein n=1 Tax=Aethina tumida TaxID=116153 RepID=UPI00096B490B|nr:RNA transcription, translation and transport factor protein [Aethina tumida]